MERRLFIKNSCKACLGIALAGAAATLLEGCATLPVYKTKAVDDIMAVPVEQFAQTQQLIVRNSKLDYDILLVKREDGTYKALYMQCSHQNQPLSATQKGLYCTAHGSTFDLEGNVTKEPAISPLTAFKTKTENQSIIIYLKK